MLLRKLGAHNRKSLLYQAFRELGRVERTLFLLKYMFSAEIRQNINAQTTKVESFNEFLDWISFGGPIVKSGDPVEQEKQLKYATLVANTVMLSNVADLTSVLTAMIQEGHDVTPELVGHLSPYIRDHIRRFRRFVLDMNQIQNRLTPLQYRSKPHCRIPRNFGHFDRIGHNLPSSQHVMGIFGTVTLDHIVEHNVSRFVHIKLGAFDEVGEIGLIEGQNRARRCRPLFSGPRIGRSGAQLNMQCLKQLEPFGIKGRPAPRALARSLASLSSRVPSSAPIKRSSAAHSASRSINGAMRRASSRREFRPSGPPRRMTSSSRLSNSVRVKVRLTSPPRFRDGAILSRNARAVDDKNNPPTKGRSLSSGAAPLCERIVRPGSSISRLRSDTTKIDPSAAGRFSMAVRSAISAPGA